MIDRERDPFDCCSAELDTAGELDHEHENRPGLPALSYRLGRHGDFFARMLERMPNERNGAGPMSAPPLGRLTYRGNDDPTIALLDASASMLDVLAFYQERIVNEGFIRTSLERRSVLEQARSIGYEMRPGVAASTLLAFTVDDAAGSPDRVTVPVGTQVLSIPKKDELPQTFETIEPLDARVEWNNIRVHTPWTTLNQTIETGSQVLYLDRRGRSIARGDALLLVDVDENADDVRLLRRVHRVTDVPSRGYRRVELQPTGVATDDSVLLKAPKVFAFGLRTRFFGHDAPPADSRAIEIQRIFAAGIPAPVQCVALAPDDAAPAGKLGASGFKAVPADSKEGLDPEDADLWRTIRIWNLDEDRLERTLAIDDTVTALAFSPENSYLAATTFVDNEIHLRIWEVETGELVGTSVVGPNDEITQTGPVEVITFQEPDELDVYRIATIGADKQAVLWDFDRSRLLKYALQPDQTLDLSALGDFAGDPRRAERQDDDGNDYSLVGDKNGATIYRARMKLDAVPDEVTLGEGDNVIDVDGVYRKLIPKSWLLISDPEHTEAYEIDEVSTHFRSEFGISKRVSRLTVNIETGAAPFSLRETEIYAESDELPLAEVQIALPEPLPEPDTDSDTEPEPEPGPSPGKVIRLAEAVEGLEELEGRTVIVEGRPASASADAQVTEGSTLTAILPGDKSVTLTVAAVDPDGRPVRLVDENGFGVALDEELDLLVWDEEAEPVYEVATVASVDNTLTPPKLTFAGTLQRFYDWRSVRILGNVAVATHGETVTEVLGSGDGLARNQRFKLGKPPLTFVPAQNASGLASTLQIRVNGVLWEERGSLLEAKPDDEVFIVRIQDDGITEVTFGDGLRGARLPTGAENVVATYRSGLGAQGEVDAGQLALLKTKPLGIRGVTNPLPATGAEPAETEPETRVNAPLTVLVLGRVVSIQDYEDFAKTFPGVGKAQAVSMWDGFSRLVHLTVGTEGGTPITEGSPLDRSLRGALDAVRDIHQLMTIEGYEERRFGLSAGVMVDPRYLPERVLAAVESRLVEAFAYQAREFGQSVTASEIVAAMHGVAGVVAVDLDALFCVQDGAPVDCDEGEPIDVGNGKTAPTQRLGARIAYLEEGKPKPAELLVIEPSLIHLETMS